MAPKLVLKALLPIALVGLCAAVFLQPSDRPNFTDFDVYWVAGGKAARHATVYDVQGHYQFKYSPFVALLWAIPTQLPGSRYAWRWLHYAATGAGFCLIWYWLARAIDPRRARWLWMAVLGVFVVGLRDELKLGQANLWPFLLVLPAFFAGPRPAAARGFDGAAFAMGAAWGLSMQWKLYALVLAPLWLLRRRPQVFVGAAAISALTLWLGLGLSHGFAFALDENVRWLRSLTASSEVLLVSKYNVSLLGILGKWSERAGGRLGSPAYALWVLAALAFLGGLLWAEREAATAQAPLLRFWSAAWAWAGVTVLTPLVWPYWLLLCVPLFLVYAASATACGLRAAGLSFFCVSAVFCAMNWAQNFGVVHAGGSLLATLLLMADALRRARGHDRAALARSPQLPLWASVAQ